MSMKILLNKCCGATRDLFLTAKSNDLMLEFFEFPECDIDYSFRLKFKTPIDTIDDDRETAVITQVLLSYPPMRSVQGDFSIPTIEAVLLCENDDQVFCSQLGFPSTQRYYSVTALIETLVQIAEGKSDQIEEKYECPDECSCEC